MMAAPVRCGRRDLYMPHPSSRALAALLLSLSFCSGLHAEPFATRDQSPLLTGFGLPMPLPARLAKNDAWQATSSINWGSSAIDESTAREVLTVDAETREVRFTLGRRIGERWAVQLQLPYFYIGGGVLDSFIDGFHDAFGLPEGARPRQPQDALRLRYQRDGITLIDQNTSSSGIGEVSLDVGYELRATQDSALTAWVSIKVPTAKERTLRGSGAVDVSFSLAGQRSFAERWEAFGQASITWLGDGDLLQRQQRNFVASAMAGATFRVVAGLHAKLQLDVHSAVFDGSDIDYLGEAAILNIGGEYRFKSGWIFDAGVSEDVIVDASPDLVLLFGLRRGVRGF
jgi:hypothetical protein